MAIEQPETKEAVSNSDTDWSDNDNSSMPTSTGHVKDKAALFGTDDDISSSDDEQEQQQPVKQESKLEETSKDNLFGSESEDGESDVKSDDEMDVDRQDQNHQEGEEEEEEEEEELEIAVSIPKTKKLEDDSENIHIAIMPNFLHVDTKEFDKETYEEEEEDFDDPHKVRLCVENTIRWRKNPETNKIESNARFIKWSDGSMSLLVGSEMFQITTKDLSKDNQILYNLHPSEGLLVSEAQLKNSIAFRPFSTASKTHKKLTATVLARHQKVNKTKFIGSVTNPELAKLEMERLENEKIKNRKKLEAKRRVTSSRYGELTADDLEFDEEEEAMAMRNSRVRSNGNAATAGKDGELYEEEYDDDFVVSDDHVEYEEGGEDYDDELEESAATGSNKRELSRADGSKAVQEGESGDSEEDEADGNVFIREKSSAGADKRRRMVMSDDEDDE